MSESQHQKNAASPDPVESVGHAFARMTAQLKRKERLASVLSTGVIVGAAFAVASYVVPYPATLEPVTAKLIQAMAPTVGFIVGLALGVIWSRYSESIKLWGFCTIAWGRRVLSKIQFWKKSK